MLVGQILVQSENEVDHWRHDLLEALGPNGQLMVNLIPELEFVIGKQPPAVELSPQEARGRFHWVFRRFLAAFARPEHPLALFLDDLQWLDAATLDLLGYLLTHPDVKHVLLIGAYRDNEVTATHPLTRALDEIRKAGGPVRAILLAPLARDDVAQLTADSLNQSGERTSSLAQLIFEKTNGNPFFVVQFLATLVEEQRAVLLLVMLEGLSYREVADIQGVPIGTVMSRLARARAHVKAALEGVRPALRRVK